jgi:hypothetical protein
MVELPVGRADALERLRVLRAGSTSCSPIGFGRSDERVVKTPLQRPREIVPRVHLQHVIASVLPELFPRFGLPPDLPALQSTAPSG